MTPREKFKPNLPLYSGPPIFLRKKNKLLFDFQICFYLTHFSTSTYSELSNLADRYFPWKLTRNLYIADTFFRHCRFGCINEIYIFIAKFKVSWHSYSNITKKKLIMSLFLILQFNYCPLVWICHSRSMNNKINRLHETCDHIIYSDKTSSFEELYRKTDLSSYEHLQKTCEHLQLNFKVYKNFSPPIVSDHFSFWNNPFRVPMYSCMLILECSYTLRKLYIANVGFA